MLHCFIRSHVNETQLQVESLLEEQKTMEKQVSQIPAIKVDLASLCDSAIRLKSESTTNSPSDSRWSMTPEIELETFMTESEANVVIEFPNERYYIFVLLFL